MKLLFIALVYSLIAALKYFLSKLYIHQCEELLDKYIHNHLTNSLENYALVNSFKRHFRRNSINSDIFSNPKTITINEPRYTSAYVNNLQEAIGQYKDRQKCSKFWLYYDIFDKLSFIYVPSSFKKTSAFSFLLSVLEWFALYLATLALDTSGIGHTISSALYRFLTKLF